MSHTEHRNTASSARCFQACGSCVCVCYFMSFIVYLQFIAFKVQPSKGRQCIRWLLPLNECLLMHVCMSPDPAWQLSHDWAYSAVHHPVALRHFMGAKLQQVFLSFSLTSEEGEDGRGEVQNCWGLDQLIRERSMCMSSQHWQQDVGGQASQRAHTFERGRERWREDWRGEIEGVEARGGKKKRGMRES